MPPPVEKRTFITSFSTTISCGRRCGHGRRIGDDGLRQFGMGRLISGQLLLIFLLLPGTVNRETEKQNPDKYDAYD